MTGYETILDTRARYTFKEIKHGLDVHRSVRAPEPVNDQMFVFSTQVALPSYLFVESFTATLPIAMGFAAGSMIWVVFAELVPDALEDLDHGTVATTITVSAAW